ncbi:winged helix-turn-helix domain-containing protein [Streptomyces sp. H10-C2]|uniref:ArsR/SmtB family transcription factor n=1 Tax=unclassified Streptomyces TaxID=2593676 RepID=UPI0024B9DBAE|nr:MULTISPECIES: winged helix-turn-helix domain-containing protein [unclassified Streptomyces]MDJ0346880.1 winged helix-turn-helix domain-containing protein [Streptomyces sp. PH10-H1]MDJ0375172.1 winged helix-turn-helix domain-containing protein [Streptomyces sp. H10-C2]
MPDELARPPQPSEAAESTEPEKPTRHIDARSLRGLAHPLRMRILEFLNLDGPATSTRLAERLGENTGTVSWHLRQLAEHGFIEEEVGRGTKRERWWRAVKERRTLNSTEFRYDPDTRGALSVYIHELVQQTFGRVADYLADEWDGAWQGIGTLADRTDLRMTPAQLHALNTELLAVIDRHTPAPGAEPGADALPVIVQIQSFPRKERGGA